MPKSYFDWSREDDVPKLSFPASGWSGMTSREFSLHLVGQKINTRRPWGSVIGWFLCAFWWSQYPSYGSRRQTVLAVRLPLVSVALQQTRHFIKNNKHLYEQFHSFTWKTLLGSTKWLPMHQDGCNTFLGGSDLLLLNTGRNILNSQQCSHSVFNIVLIPAPEMCEPSPAWTGSLRGSGCCVCRQTSLS